MVDAARNTAWDLGKQPNNYRSNYPTQEWARSDAERMIGSLLIGSIKDTPSLILWVITVETQVLFAKNDIMAMMEDVKPKSDGSSEGSPLHHHCCHHHPADPHLCHQWETSSVDPSTQDIYFRPDAGEGLWLPALLPLGCFSVCALAGTATTLPLALLALQSCICCYHLRRCSSSYETKILDVSGGSAKSCKKQSCCGASKRRRAHCVVLQPLPHRRSSGNQLVLVCSAVTAILLCLAAGAGVVVSITAVMVNVGVVRVVCEWLVSHHSRTFSVGEWLFAGECASVCVAYSVYALLCGCAAHSPYTHCQMDAFLQDIPSYATYIRMNYSASLALGARKNQAAGINPSQSGTMRLHKALQHHDDISDAANNTALAETFLFTDLHDNCNVMGSPRCKLSVVVSGLLLLLLLLLPPSRSTSVLVLLPLVGVVGVVGVIWSSLLLGEFSPLWLLNEFIGKQPNSGLRRPLLLCWWSFCSVLAWLSTAWVYRYRSVPVPVVRKVYHVLAVAVCVAGVVVDASFLRLASVGASIACLLMEVVRTLDVPLVSTALTSAFSNFLDEKDRSGKLILSPVYLLVGLSLPLWLLPLPIPYCVPCPRPSFSCPSGDSVAESKIPDSDPSSDSIPENMESFSPFIRPTKIALCQLAGVLAVGIGDTFASICGTRYGKHKYPGSKKSLEGSACGVGSQLVVVVVLVVCGVVEVGSEALVWWWGVFATIWVASVVEAFTNQVDNLALPLVTFIGFCWTEYFANTVPKECKPSRLSPSLLQGITTITVDHHQHCITVDHHQHCIPVDHHQHCITVDHHQHYITMDHHQHYITVSSPTPHQNITNNTTSQWITTTIITENAVDISITPESLSYNFLRGAASCCRVVLGRGGVEILQIRLRKSERVSQLYHVYVQLYHVYVQLYHVYVQLYRVYVQLYRVYVQLYRVYVQLYHVYVQLYHVYVQLFHVYVQLFHVYVQLFHVYVQLYHVYVQLYHV
ncbi:hypothetical protein FHG87_016237 [Trinorchestia longiramus]|nr:hypothetical protein FHG87_016237 [Trinorchestia longiramus]